ncbi:hypothetical protein STTU_0601 [Streptomyces sp. Tu6071]|nr:hypothetical protein STTU_0601 [Streptomyces sp. Tu6071]
MFGVLLGSESAKAVDELPTHRWAAWTAACVSGIGSATWLSQSPWSFTWPGEGFPLPLPHRPPDGMSVCHARRPVTTAS